MTLVVGSSSLAGILLLLFRGHVPFSPQASVFEDVLAVIAILATAMIVVTLVLDHLAWSRLIHHAGWKMVDTAQTHEEARQAFQAVSQSVSGRLARWWLGLPVAPVVLGDNDGHGAD